MDCSCWEYSGLLLLGAAQRQERDHVRLGERGLGAESRRELVDVPMQTDGHVVFFNPGSRVDVDKTVES